MAIEAYEERPAVKEVFPRFHIFFNPDEDGLAKLEEHAGTCSLDIAERAAGPHLDGSDGVAGLLLLGSVARSGRPPAQEPGGLTLAEIARAMNLGQERTRQIISGALQELRWKLRREDNGSSVPPRRVPTSLIAQRRHEWKGVAVEASGVAAPMVAVPLAPPPTKLPQDERDEEPEEETLWTRTAM